MSATYKVFVQAVGSLTMVDVTAFYQDKGSNLAEAARDKATEATAIFWLDVGAPGTPDIREFAEIWAGWVDNGSGDFLSDPRPFGGYIMVSVGSASGALHIITCTISSYTILLPRRSVIGWPTGDDATGIPTAGVGAGYSVGDWFKSNAGLNSGYSGVIRTHFPNMDYSGVDAVFDTLIFTAGTRPGNPDPDYPFSGCWSFTNVESVVQDIIGAVRKVWPGMEPVYWVEAVADGAVVRPRFRLIDNADTSGTVRGAFSTSATTGEFRLE